jgi:hypothetical protein
VRWERICVVIRYVLVRVCVVNFKNLIEEQTEQYSTEIHGRKCAYESSMIPSDIVLAKLMWVL